MDVDAPAKLICIFIYIGDKMFVAYSCCLYYVVYLGIPLIKVYYYGEMSLLSLLPF